MKIMSILSSLLFVGLTTLCSPDLNNPLDEQSSSFVPPEINVDAKTSTIINGETIHFNSGVLSVSGNKDISRFRYQLDDGDWSKWQPEGSFTFSELDDGGHTLIIETKYDKGTKVYNDTIQFGVKVDGFKPGFVSNYVDTFISTFPGKSLSITETAVGADSIKYSWHKNGEIEKEFSGNTLSIDSFSIKDTGSYYCIATNKYGEINSRTYWLKYLTPKGSIKAYLIDIKDNSKVSDAEIKVSPLDTKIKSDKTGKFVFTGLSEGKYSISVSHSEYKDTTIEGIKIGDSTTVDLGSIYLRNSVLYTIKFDGNGNDTGKSPLNENEYKKGVKVAIPNPNTLFRRGYSFAGWNTQEDGKGNQYKAGDSLTITGNVTLHAQWSINEYTVRYSGNENTAGVIPTENKYPYNFKVIAAKIGDIVKDGYKFIKWSSNKDGFGFSVLPDSLFNVPDSNVVLYAQWEKLPLYKVVYNGNGKTDGEVPVDDSTYYPGKKVVVKGNPNLLEREGLLFAGWCMNTICEGEVMNSGSQFSMPDSVVTLYAKWTNKPTYSFVYYGNGNESGQPPEKTSAEAGEQITIAEGNSLVKKGYVVENWNTTENGSGKKYEIGQKVTMDTVNIDLYAQWEKAQYTVTYHGNGSTAGSVPQKTTHFNQTEIAIALAGTMQKTGYTFQSWNTDSTGNGIDYNAGSQILIDKNIVLYARWNKNKYKVFYIGNGNDGGTSATPVEYEYNSTVTVADKGTLFKTGFSFNGWNREKIGSDGNIAPNSTFSMKALNDTLYAQWENPKEMVLVISKDQTFLMGGSMYNSEKPIHPVMLTKNIWFDKTEVTQKSFQQQMSAAYPAYFSSPKLWDNGSGKGDNYPAYGVNWYEALLYCNARTKSTGSNDTVYTYTKIKGKIGNLSNKCELDFLTINLSRKGFRLPTEAEWEFAAKGGSTIIYYSESQLDKIAWHVDNSNYLPQLVAQKESNNYSLFDMLGNVQEWVNDWYNYYDSSNTVVIDPIFNPTLPPNNTGRVVRGSHCGDVPDKVNNAFRYYAEPLTANGFTGFRCCLPVFE
jgi:uncharacterized repeat protein (TIGR02543 family)